MVKETSEEAVVAVVAVEVETLIKVHHLMLKVLFFYFFYIIYFLVVGSVTHSVDENTICVSNTSGKIPYFNAVIYNENIQQLGKVDEIYGGPKDNVCNILIKLIFL